MPDAEAIDPRKQQMDALVNGISLSNSVAVFAEIGIADHLAKAGACTVAEVSAAFDLHPGALRRVLRALSSVGVVTRTSDGKYGLAPLGELLRSDIAGSMRALARFTLTGSIAESLSASNLLETLRTGQPYYERRGTTMFEYIRTKPDESAVFYEAMVGLAQKDSVTQEYDFSRFDTVVDVGGGRGAFLAQVLAEYPSVHGVLFDKSQFVDEAQKLFDDAGVGDRCEIIEGDYFDSVPAGGDAYILARVIHDWDDQRALQILRNCRAVMTDDARLLLGERVMPEAGNGSETSAFAVDVSLLCRIPGSQRTADEYQALLRQAGFDVTHITPSAAGMLNIIEATPK